MVQGKDYVIRGGAAGRERLRMLSRVMYASTASLFDRFRFKDWQQCLDIGCGGGDVTLELARRIGPSGKAVGADIDETQLDIARREADAKGIRNVEFRSLDIRTTEEDIGSVDTLVQELTRFAENPRTVAGVPRVIQAWGYRPVAS